MPPDAQFPDKIKIATAFPKEEEEPLEEKTGALSIEEAKDESKADKQAADSESNEEQEDTK